MKSLHWLSLVLVIVGAGLASSLLLRSNARRRLVADDRVEDPVDDLAAAS